MRVTSALWVGAFVRRCFGEGAHAAIMKHGAEEAGAIFVVADRLNGSGDLYGPAPQASFDADQPDDRMFQMIMGKASMPEIDARLEREKKFDSDVWIVAVEDRDGRVPLDVIRS